ncbi:MAG: LmeA family phospholipid-binding protein [Armatimonadetes bacterium]|nr:LmeA family phospholipid-binding protein [Armatimonadota bacterium]
MAPLLLGIAALFGIGIRAQVQHVERDAAADIAAKLTGPAKEVWLRTIPEPPFGLPFSNIRRGEILARHFSTEGLPLFTQPWRPQSGRLGELVISLNDFSLAGLRVESLAARIPDCRFDAGLALHEHKLRLSQSGVGQGSVTLRQEDLERFILKKFREIKSVKVTLREGWVWVEGDGEFVLVKSHFLVLARLRPAAGTQIVLADAKIWLNDYYTVGFARDQLLKALTPVLDLDRDLHLQGAIQLESIECHEGFLTASGKATIPIAPG